MDFQCVKQYVCVCACVYVCVCVCACACVRGKFKRTCPHSQYTLNKERDTLSEAVVSLRTVVTFVTWLISRTIFSSSELVL